jgi:hypothetical protein
VHEHILQGSGPDRLDLAVYVTDICQDLNEAIPRCRIGVGGERGITHRRSPPKASSLRSNRTPNRRDPWAAFEDDGREFCSIGGLAKLRPRGLGWNTLRTNPFSREASRASGKVDSHDGTGASARTRSMNDLKGKVAVVTGASKGIGAAIARSLSAAGAAVAVNYTSSKEDADRVVADIKANSGEAIAVKGDVTKADDVRRLFAETKKAFDTLDLLVNNAGVYKLGPLEEVSEDEFHREFNINVLGTLLATKEER